MNSDSDEIVQPKFRMRLRPDCIVQCVWGTEVTVALEDAVAAIDAMVKLTGGERVPLLVDTRDSHNQERSARLAFVERGDLVSAVALIVDTPLSRLMGNFFLNVNQPVAPTRLFGDEESAVAWLRGFAG